MQTYMDEDQGPRQPSGCQSILAVSGKSPGMPPPCQEMHETC